MNPTNRERLLNAATEVFLDHGYDASIDMIIGRAGVARQTFYNHFENKQCLFAETMRNCISAILIPLNDRVGDLHENLEKFAAAYRQQTLSPQGIAGYRIMTSQVQRFPDLSAETFGQGLGQLLESLTDFLRRAMEAGKLRRDDASFAAEMLLSMLAGLDRTRLLFGVANPEQDEKRRVERIVDGFLRMFAVA
jgi:TetR/AcrR family transcriptional regulator, mexJK operon transcriptional repressor